MNKKDVSLPAPMWDVGGRSGIFKPLLRHYVANANAWVIAGGSGDWGLV